MKAVQLTQGTQEWHEFRLKGIGGSDAPVVDGTSPYRTIRELFFEKSGKPTPIEEDASKEFIFAKGHRTEGLIRKEFRDLTGVDMVPICGIHPQFEYIRCSLDGFDPKLGVLEAKLVGKAALVQARDGMIPPHHFTQIQHQMEVTGADVAHWFGHDGSKAGVLVPIKRDAEFLKRLMDSEHRFWQDVLSGKEPPLGERDYLIPDDQTVLKELRDAKELAENAQAQYEAIRAKAVETYKHSRIKGGGLTLYKSERAGSLKVKDIPEVSAILETLPEEYLQKFTAKSSVSWTVRIDGKKESA